AQSNLYLCSSTIQPLLDHYRYLFSNASFACIEANENALTT
ncbi:35233_t:CDS:1, partial [Racocetra persica]